MKSDPSIYQILQVVRISTFDKTPINELLKDFQKNQNVNELHYNIFDQIN